LAPKIGKPVVNGSRRSFKLGGNEHPRFFGIDKLEQPSFLAFSQSVFRFVTVFGSSILIGSPITLGSAFTY
jgi:hypothetical protein